MAWFRRSKDDDEQPRPDHGAPDDNDAPKQDGDSPQALTSNTYQLDRYVNANAGRFPPGVVVLVRATSDMLRRVIAFASAQRLDPQATITVHSILTDYMPTTLGTFLAMAPASHDVPLASGRTPVESLEEQVDSLYSAAAEVLDAVKNADANRLMTQGSFLRTKFSGSDLDL